MAGPLQNDKVFQAAGPIQVTNGQTLTSSAFDVRGFKDLSISLLAGTLGTSFAVTSFVVQESDDNTTYATGPAAVQGGTATSATVGLTIPAGITTQDNKATITVDVKLKGRKRYIRTTCAADSTVVIGVVMRAAGETAEQAPNSAAERGARVYGQA